MKAMLPAILVLGVTQIIGYGTCYYDWVPRRRSPFRR
jgi:hypothetical protein